jgi:hypothetical protein
MKTKLISSQPSRPASLLAIVSAAGIGLLANLHSAGAQPPPPPPPQAADPYQQPTANSLQGTVAQYLINPRGDVDGLLLTDNTIVRFPPHLGPQLVQTVQPQAAVKVDGYSASAGTIQATTITNTTSGRSIVDTPPASGAPPPPPSDAAQQPMSASGTIKALTHAPRGEIDGAILSDGTIVHFGPENGEQFAALLRAGQPLAATGYGTANQYGKSLEASALGASANQLQPITAGPRERGPRGRQPRGRGPRDADAPPPPPPAAPMPPAP